MRKMSRAFNGRVYIKWIRRWKKSQSSGGRRRLQQVQAPNECSDTAGTSDALATGVLDYESVTAATTLLSWSSTEEASVAEETTVCYTVGNPAGVYEAPEGPYASFSIDLPLVTAEPTAQTQVLSGAAGQMLATVGDGTTQTIVATFIGIFLALIATCCVVAIVVAIIAITVTAKRKKILGGRERRKSMADSDDIQLAVLQASKRGEGDSAMTAEGSTFDASGKALPVGWKRHFDEEENLSYYVGEDERECCVLSLFTSFSFRSPVSPHPPFVLCSRVQAASNVPRRGRSRKLSPLSKSWRTRKQIGTNDDCPLCHRGELFRRSRALNRKSGCHHATRKPVAFSSRKLRQAARRGSPRR